MSVSEVVSDMKKLNNLCVFFFIFFFASSSFALTINIGGGLCSKSNVGTSVWNNTSKMPCSLAMSQCPGVSDSVTGFGYQLFPELAARNTCYSTCTFIAQECLNQSLLDPSGYLTFVPVVSVVTALCDAAQCDNLNNYQQSTIDKSTLTGVAIGGEQAAADAYCQSSSVAYAAPQTGYLRTGGLGGTEADVSLGAVQGTVDVTVRCWKRGQYTLPSGTIIPLAGLPGGSGGSGSGGGGNPLDSGVSSAGSPKGGIYDPLWTANINQGPIGNAGDPLFVTTTNPGSGGGGGGGIGVGDLQNGMGDTSSYTGGSNVGAFNPASGINTTDQSFAAMKTNFDTFKTGLASSSLFSAHATFFSAAAGVGTGTAPKITVNGGHTFGSHDFDFAIYTPWLLILKSVVLVVFAFISIRIVVLKGG